MAPTSTPAKDLKMAEQRVMEKQLGIQQEEAMTITGTAEEDLQRLEQCILEKEVARDTQPMPTTASRRGDEMQPGAFAEGPDRIGYRFRPSPPGTEPSNRTTVTSTGVAAANNNHGLIHAREVDEESGLPQAEPMEDPDHDKGENEYQRWKRQAACGVMVLLNIIIVVVLYTLIAQKEGSDVSLAPTQAPTPNINREYLWSLLPEQTQDKISLLSEDIITPQTAAFEWLVQDPSLQLYSPLRVHQRYALATFYHATRGERWKDSSNWLNHSVHECDWYGTDLFFFYARPMEAQTSPCEEPQPNNTTNTTMTTERIYKRLWITNNALNGTLPEEIFSLMTTLESINFFNDTKLRGTMSSNIGKLTNLRMLSMVMTEVSGTLPSQLGLLSSLEILYLEKYNDKRGATLDGPLPSEVGLLTKLEQFTAGHSRLTSTIPTEVGNLSKLKFLMLQNNHLTGPIPTEIGATQLQNMYLYENRLSSTIPSELGLLSDLLYLHLYNNYNINGTIPTSLGNLSVLKDLMLSQNSLSGTLPLEALRKLETLEILYLSHNPHLSGKIPAQELLLSNWSRLKALDAFNETAIRLEEPLSANNSREGEQRLKEATSTSFWRYYYQCNRKFPCEVDYDDLT